MIEAGWRQGAFEIGEIFTQVPLDRERKLLLAGGLLFGERERGLRQLRIHHRRRDDLLRIERGETPRQILQLANVPRPAIALEPLQRALVELLERQPFALGLSEEMPNEVRHVLDPLAQRRQ